MMRSTSPVKLGAIGYQLGEAKPIASLIDDNRSGLKKVIDSAQFSYYLDAQEADAYQLALASIEQTLSASNLTGEDIDLMIFASDSMCSVSANHMFYRQLADQFGIDNAYPMIVTMSECANFHVALEVAQSSITAGKARNVLLVATDKSELVSPATRIVGDGIGVMSDGAASCLVSAELDDGLILLQVERQIRGELLRVDLEPQHELLLRAQASESIFASMFNRHKLHGSDLKQLFCSNLNMNILEIFLQQSGIDRSQIYQANHQRLAHCLSCDSLINLRDYVHTQGILAGESFALLGMGPVTWGGALLAAEYELYEI